MNTVVEDIRYAVRTLFKARGFTLVAVITLALGIGATTAIFSVVYGMLINPLPFKDADRLVYLSQANPQGGRIRLPPSPQAFELWRQAKLFDGVEQFTRRLFSLSNVPEPESFLAQPISTGMLQFLGVAPQLGRDFIDSDSQAGAEKVVLIGDPLWKRQFGSDRNILGKHITLNDQPYTVIGVMPPQFQLQLIDAQAWLPIVQTGQQSAAFFVMARLRKGTKLQMAQAELDVLSARLAEQNPGKPALKALITTPGDDTASTVREAILILFGAVGFVLLIACANVASLLLSRNSGRYKEIAIRTALGAGRFRVVRHLLFESLVLAFLGGAAGLLLASWLLSLIIQIRPTTIPQLQHIAINTHVLLFSFFVSLCSGLLFGLLPAMRSSRVDLSQALKQGPWVNTSDHPWFRSALVVAEISLSLVLLIGAGLLIRSFVRLQQTNPGFNPDHLVSMMVSLPVSHYSNPAQQREFYEQLLERIRKEPRVTAAELTSGLPTRSGISIGDFEIEDRTLDAIDRPPYFAGNYPGPDYFRVLGIPILEGRSFVAADNDAGTNSVIINQEVARRYWPNESPIGKRLRFDKKEAWHTIVGVAGNVKAAAIDDDTFSYQLYYSTRESSLSSVYIVVRTNDAPAKTLAAMKTIARNIDGTVGVKELETVRQLLADSLDRQRFNLVLLSMFSGLATVLAAIGVYGLMSYSVSKSIREFGIRAALGAQPRDIFRLVIGAGMRLAIIGVIVGAIGALAITKVMDSLLYQITATDPMTFLGVSALLAAVALLACYLPARRVVKIDPLTALRHE